MKMDLNFSGFGTTSLAPSYLSGPAFMQVLALVESQDSDPILKALEKYSEGSRLIHDADKAPLYH